MSLKSSYARLIDSITEYFEEHRKNLFEARKAIADGNGSLAYDILGRSIRTLDELMEKLKASK